MRNILLFLWILTPLDAQQPIRGFPRGEWKRQQDFEARARRIPDAARMRTYLERMSAKPHPAGSKGSREVAEYALGLFRTWGFEAQIETFEALLPYPTTRVLEMSAPVQYRAELQEPGLPGEPEGREESALPPYSAYGADGDVTAPLVYVNYGLPEDYQELERAGIEVRGKIVIARYGRNWRGSKVKAAQERGALACLLYSDPRDDGFFQGEVYPAGAFRPPQGVQRGSVLDLPLYVGDPLSPGWASERGATRLDRGKAQNLMKLPVLPISYGDAAHFLAELRGPVAPEHWRGALGLTYRVGPGPAVVRVQVTSDWATRPVHNVVATIAGSHFPEEWIVYGNHHDAWVHGASDPLSGVSALLETARAASELLKSGWRPKRTIRFVLWDAEEFGLIGSTEWVEKHRSSLQQKTVAYLNSDANGKGAFAAAGSHSLETFLGEVLRDTPDVITGKPILGSEERRQFRLGALGAGSDYVAFLHHAGIASLNLGFDSESSGVYHSAYDSFDWYTRFSDTSFSRGRTFAGLMMTVLLRLAGATLLPYEFGALAAVVESYAHEIERLAGGRVELTELKGEVKRLAQLARSVNQEFEGCLRRPGCNTQAVAANAILLRAERALLSSGLPGRPWYKHQLYAPGQYTGYAAKTLPAIREAAESGNWESAVAQGREAASAIHRLNVELSRLRGVLTGP